MVQVINELSFIVDSQFQVAKGDGHLDCSCGKNGCTHVAQVASYLNSNSSKRKAGETPQQQAKIHGSSASASTPVIHNPYSTEEIEALRILKVIPETSPIAALWLLHRYAQDSDLSPFKRQIYLQVRNVNEEPSYSVELGIDGLRAIADRTGKYAGSDDANFEYEGGSMVKKATVTVYKIVEGIRCPFTASARWAEYCPSTEKRAFMWRKMPHGQLAKCAEALALRKGFPNLGGYYISEEMDQAGELIVTAAAANEDLLKRTAEKALPFSQQPQPNVSEQKEIREKATQGQKKAIEALCTAIHAEVKPWLQAEFQTSLEEIDQEAAAAAITKLNLIRAGKAA